MGAPERGHSPFPCPRKLGSPRSCYRCLSLASPGDVQWACQCGAREDRGNHGLIKGVEWHSLDALREECRPEIEPLDRTTFKVRKEVRGWNGAPRVFGGVTGEEDKQRDGVT